MSAHDQPPHETIRRMLRAFTVLAVVIGSLTGLYIYREYPPAFRAIGALANGWWCAYMLQIVAKLTRRG